MAVGGEAFAAGTNYVWDGGANSGDWAAANNWGANVAPTVDGQANLQFAGTIQLSTTNTFTGTSSMRSVAFQAGAGAFTLSGNAISIANAAGIVNNSSNLQTINLAGIVLTANNTVFGAGSAGMSVSSPISGAFSISIPATSTGTLSLSGSNSFTGAVTMTAGAGALRISNSNALGTTAGGVTITTGGALELTNNINVGAEALSLVGTGISSGGALRNITGTNTYGGLITLAGAVRINSDAGLLQLDVATGNAIAGTADNMTFGGAGDILVNDGITNTTATLTKDGAGILTLAASNTYSGATTISAGWLQATTSTNALGQGTLSLGGGNLEISNDTGLALNRNTTLTASGTIRSDRLTAGAGVTHTLGTLGIGAQTLTLDTDAATVTSGTAGLTFGAVTLSAAGATFNASANTLLTLGAVSGNTFGFTVGGAGDTAITGVIGTTTGGLTKTGAGTLTLSAVNTYTGTTTITGGTLTVGIASALGTGTVAINGGVLNLGTFSDSVSAITLTSGQIVGTGTLTSSANFSTTSGTIAAPLAGTGFGIAQGSGTTVVTASNAFTGGSTVASGGVLNLRNAGALGTSGTATVSSGGAIELQGSGTLARVLSLSGSGVSAGGALRNISGTNGISAGITLGAASLITSNADLLTLSGTIVATNQNLAFGGAGNITASNTIALGTGSLTKTGAGLLTLSASNSYSGTTTIQSGTVSVNSVATGATNQPLGTGARLDLGVASTSSGRLLYTGGSGTLSKNVFALGNGTDTIQNAGTGLLTLSGTLTKNGTILRLQGGAQGITVTGTIVGALANSDLAVQNGLTTLSATNTYTGPTFVNSSGTLALGVSNAIPSNSAVTLGGSDAGGDGGTGVLSMASFTNQIGSLAFSGSGGTVKMAPTASATSTVVLSATGAVVLDGASSTLDLTGMASGAGLYRLVGGNSLTGTFATVTGLATNYQLRYGTVNANELVAQFRANQATTFTMTTGAVTRALVNTNVTVSGTITNSSPVNSTALALGLASTGLTGSAFTTGSVTAGSSLAVSGTLAAGSVAGTQNWTITNTDPNAITTTSTATGSLQVVNQRTFSTSTGTIALGTIHQGGLTGSPNVIVTSTGLNATTANATLGSFTGGLSGVTLGLTSGSAQFVGASSPQSTTYTLSGTNSTLGAISGTYTSAGTAEFGSIPDVTVAVTGTVYSGQSTWAADGGGSWGTISGTGSGSFGLNWGTDQGSPGLDAGFTTTDTATFGPTLTGGTAVILLNGASPSLAGITFNTTAGVYDLDVGTGGTGRITLAAGGTSAATIDVLAGSHEIHTELQFGSNLAVSVGTSSALTLHGAISGATYSLTKTGAGLLTVRGNNNYSGGTLISGGTLAIGNAVSPLGSGAVVVIDNATLDLAGFTIGNTIDATYGHIVNPSAANIDISGTATISGTGPITGSYTVLPTASGTFTSPLGNPAGLGGTIVVQGGGAVVTTSTISSNGTVLVNTGGQATLSGPVDGTVTTAGLTTFAAGLEALADVTVSGGTATFAGTTLGDVNVDVSGTNTGGATAIFTGTVAKTAHAYASGTITILGSVASTADVKAEVGGIVQILGSGTFGQAAMTNNGVVVVNRTDALQMSTAISGSGALEKQGSGTLELTGSSSFSGGTTISAGTVALSGAGALASQGAVSLANATALDISAASGDRTIGALSGTAGSQVILGGNTLTTNGATSTTFAGDIGGAGGFTKAGAGTLTLTTANTYTGATVISAGTLALSGSGNIASSSGVSLSGSGARLDISAASGNRTMLSLESLAGSSVHLGANTLTANNATNNTFAGVISGAGGFTKAGAGTLTFTAAQDFTGTARVDAGTLAIDAANTLASANKIYVASGGTVGATAAGLTIPSGQTLGGYGRVDVGANALTFNSGAFLSPGGSVGTLNETGATTWNGGMTYVFEVNDADGTPGVDPGWDLFNTTGGLTLNASGTNQVVVDLTSLNGASPGSAANFNQNYSYAWKFMVAGSAIGTFDSSWFNVTATNFSNTTNGSFYVARGDQIGNIGASGSTNELYVVYAAAPEPGSITIAAIGLGILGWRLRRRSRVSG